MLFFDGAPQFVPKPATTHKTVTDIQADAIAAETAIVARYSALCKEAYEAGEMDVFHLYQHLIKWHRRGGNGNEGHLAWLQKQNWQLQEFGEKDYEAVKARRGTMPLLSEQPQLQQPLAIADSEVFSADAQVLPSTANAKDGAIDVVWYSGAFVPRIDRSTGEPYMLKLDMQGCRMDRLNNGAPVFDTHFTGDDFKSLVAGKAGTRAQLGVVRRAWPNGDKGMATLKFDLGDPDGADMFRKASTGILQNLSFGTFIYEREKVDAQTEGMPEGKHSLFER